MSPAAITPPPTTTTVGLKMFTSDVIPTPRWRPHRSMTARATGSPSQASSVTSGPVTARPGCEHAARARCRAPSSAACVARPPDRLAGHERLQASAARAAARARRAVLVDDHVPQLGARPDRAARQAPADDEAAADAGADREQHGVGGAARGARAPLGQHRDVRVVVDRTGSPSRSRMTSANGTSAIGRWTEAAATPRRSSMRQAIPKPTATIGSRAAARASSTAWQTESRSAAVSAWGTSRWVR